MAEQNSIRCIQMPLVDWQLLLPNSVVAEIIGYSMPEQPGAGWYDGLLSWRGAWVPIVSIEGMCQHPLPEKTARSRIAILYNLSGDDDLPYIGIILQDIPRAYLAEQDRMQSFVGDSGCEFLMGRTDMLIEQLVVPDLDAIMQAVKLRIA